MKCLFLTTRYFFPQTDGALIYSYGLLKEISKLCHKLDLVSFKCNEFILEDDLKELRKYCDNVHFVKHKNTKLMFNFSFKYSNTIKKYKRLSMSRFLKKLSREKYDVVFCDRIHMFYYMKLFPESKIILIEHNIENKVWFKYAETKKGLIKYFIKRSAILLAKEEKKACCKADNIISISRNDGSELEKMIGSMTKIKFICPTNNYDKIFNKNKIERAVMFMGSYDFFPNQESADFLINKLNPFLEKNNVKLYLVGKKPTEKMLNDAKRFSNIEITGFVESVDLYLSKCSIFINSIFSGSGMNIKLLESLGKGIPTISTQLGVRGIDEFLKRDILIFENENDCFKIIKQIIDDKEFLVNYSNKCRDIYEKMTDSKVLLRELLK